MSEGYKQTFKIIELKETETKKDGEVDITYKTKMKAVTEPTTIIVTSEHPLGVELKDELELKTVNYQKNLEDKQ